MKSIYSCLRSMVDGRSYAEWITNCQQRLTISSKGLVAFTSSFCLNQRCPSASSYHVYVADINTPYLPYLLLNSDHEFSIIEWDPSGTKLLVGDIRGTITIYTSKDYLVSDWKPYFTQSFVAETFLVAAWYHTGLVSTINVAQQNLKLPSNHLEYSDKVQQSKFGASLRLFGSKSAEGCLLISETGLVCSLTLMGDGSVDVATESLGPLRTRVKVADICYNKDGSFVVATSAGPINSTISLYQVQLTTDSLTLDDLDSCTNRLVTINCRQFNSFHLNIMSQILSERENQTNSPSAFEKVSHIKFITKDSPDDILVEVSGQNLSLLELWELEIKKKPSVHSAILEMKKASTVSQTPTVQIKQEDIKPIIKEENGSIVHTSMPNSSDVQSFGREWSFKGNHIAEKDLVAIRTPKFKIFGPNRQLNIILLAYRDHTICCLRKEDLQQIGEPLDLSNVLLSNQNMKSYFNASRSNIDNENSPYKIYQNRKPTNLMGLSNLSNPNTNGKSQNYKKSNKQVQITDIQLTCNQTCFLAIDSMSQLHAVKIPPLISCQDDKDTETYLQYMLEYSLITGNDWCDVIFCTKQESIENICDKFQDAYERQPKFMQGRCFNRQLMIRASLFRCLNDITAVYKYSDCHMMIMLNSIASTIKSMIKTEDQEQSPSEDLTKFLRSPQGLQTNFLNCQNVISRMNEKEFYAELNLIQCLQPLNQWIVELAISLIASVAQRSNQHPHDFPQKVSPQSSLLKNKNALEMIRELLIIIKIWGQQSETSLPAVQKLNDQLDVIGTLFRLISTFYSRSGLPGDPIDDQLVEECLQFINSIALPDFSFQLRPSGVASPLLASSSNNQQVRTANGNQKHLMLEFFKEPNQPAPIEPSKNERSINFSGNRKIDVVRNISLGAHPIAGLRACTRCQSVSLIKSAHSTSRAWEQRWISSCVCGGSWAQYKAATTNIVGYYTTMHQNQTLGVYQPHQMAR